MQEITPETKIARNEWVLFSETGNGLSLMDIDSGNYYNFEEMGARIWAHLAEPSTFAELCDRLISEFSVDPDTCRKETGEFVRELGKLSLVDLKA
ncbi:hypothetical protein GCM10009127_25960 [Alteraurantiacibacter aestuarii]|uniref:PqqD family peptide modification chaperone n=1 Tax=Alteraurantiacibacter aestuarii TaxID=650004 RepID=UPI0031DC2529